MIPTARLLILPFCLSAAACANPDSVLFVTKSSLGIDIDAKLATATVAYDRDEGYVGPRYDNGAVPPVVASIQTDGTLINPQIRQIFATGSAALNVVSQDPSAAKARPPDLSGGKKMMFFGTSTTTGLKIAFSSGTPDALTFGYKRKEFSFIPLGTMVTGTGVNARTVDVYPSVLASLDTRVQSTSPTDGSFLTRQFFATGTAADSLATDSTIRQIFKNEAKDSYQIYKESTQNQGLKSLDILRCYSGMDEKMAAMAWKHADQMQLYYEKEGYAHILDLAKTPTTRPKASAEYAFNVSVTDGATPTRIRRLNEHADFVCGLARVNNAPG